MEATVILAKCKQTKRMYGMRIQKMNDGDWWRTWAFAIDEKRAKNEGYDITKVQGNMYHTKDYPGCPYCGTKGFVQCNCGKLSCWNGETQMSCLWCGKNMNNMVPATKKFDVTGGDV